MTKAGAYKVISHALVDKVNTDYIGEIIPYESSFI